MKTFLQNFVYVLQNFFHRASDDIDAFYVSLLTLQKFKMIRVTCRT